MTIPAYGRRQAFQRSWRRRFFQGLQERSPQRPAHSSSRQVQGFLALAKAPQFHPHQEPRLNLQKALQEHEKKSSHAKSDVETIERKDFVYIIDEINRGEVSKIFGEYIDRSVESIDFAFRRRFTWTEITAESSLSILDKDAAWESYGVKPSDDEITKLKNRLINLNKAISSIDGLNPAYHIGGSYLLKYASYNKEEAFEKLWGNHLQGVLFEYLRGRPQISITSRFAKNNDTKDDFFLHYLLQKVLCLNIFDLKYSAASFGEFDLLLYMFSALLKKAFAQGLVRRYQTFKNNDSNIKGVVDVTRHIQNNIPFNGKIAYKNRNYTTDNSMTELIRHTIELIKTKPNGNFVLTADYEMIECVRLIQENTPAYSKNDLTCIFYHHNMEL